MIYLFEDRLERMQQYYKSKNPPEGIQHATMEYDEGSGETLESYLDRECGEFGKFKDAEGALFHKSHTKVLEGSTLGKIKDYFVSKGKIFVLFSGGIDSPNYIGKSASVNSRVFYQNLNEFSKSKDVRVLCFGVRFELCENLNFRRAIRMAVSNITIADDALKDVQAINKMLAILRTYEGKGGEVAKVAKDFVTFIEGRRDSKKPIPLAILKNQVDKAILTRLATGGV